MNAISLRNNIFFSNKKALIGFLLLEIPILSYLVYYYSSYIFLLPIIIIFGIIFSVALINFNFWILSSIIAYIPMIVIKTEGVSIAEIGVAFYIFIPMGIWFFRKIFIKKEKILSGIGDNLLVVFYICCLISVVLTIVNNFDVLLWFKEMIVFSGYLFYFPLKEYFNKNSDGLKKILIAFGVFSLATALYNLYQYRSKLALATQFFQVWGSRIGATEQVFMFCVLIIISIIFLIKSRKTQILLLSLLGIFFVALVLSFTRSYLGFTILGIFLIWLFFKKEDKIKLSVWIIILSGITTGLMLLLFNNLAQSIFQAVIGRFLEAKGRDISLVQRVIETGAIIENIFNSPIIGWGLGAKFRRYDLFYETHILSYYAHNGYLYLWYKLGILGLASFLIAYIQKLYLTYLNYRNQNNQIEKNILLVFTFMLVAFIFISITSPQFYHKPSILIMTIIWGYTESLKKKAF